MPIARTETDFSFVLIPSRKRKIAIKCEMTRIASGTSYNTMAVDIIIWHFPSLHDSRFLFEKNGTGTGTVRYGTVRYGTVGTAP